MRTLTLLVAAVAALVLPVPTAGATTATPAPAAPADEFPFPCWFAPSPGTGWTMINYGYSSCERCESVGAAGVARGDWTAYRCAWIPIGLDGAYFVFVPTAAPA